MRKKFVRICWGLLVLLIAGTAIAFIAIDKGWIGYMPDMASLQNPIDRNASTLYSADGKKLGMWTHEDNRQSVPYDSISQHVMNALVATEDVRFYEHTGIDLRAFGRAVIKRGLMGQKMPAAAAPSRSSWPSNSTPSRPTARWNACCKSPLSG